MDLAVIGPMARDARDLALALEVLGGPAGDDRKAWNWRMPASRHTRVQDFRIGYIVDDPIAPISSEVRTPYEELISALKKTGATLKQGWPTGVDPRVAAETYGFLLMSFVTADLTGKRPSSFDHARWIRETLSRLAFRQTWQQYFESCDVFLLPASFTAAFPHDHSEPIDKRVVKTPEGPRPYVQNSSYWISIASLSGLPATVAPIGLTDGGLPVGVQVLAPMWEDATSIEFAALLADVTGGFITPPAYAK
jgi:amidase